MAGGGGYAFDPEAVKKVERGLKAAVEELEATGWFSVSSQQGYGFEQMAMSGMDLSSASMAEAFEGFCEAWGAVVVQQMRVANTLAQGLNLSAGMYHEQEQYVNDSLKSAVVSATSFDPAAGTAAAGKPEDLSWGEVWDKSTDFDADYTTPPDTGQMQDQWKQVGEDFETSPWQDAAGGQENSQYQWDGAPEQEQADGQQGKSSGGK